MFLSSRRLTSEGQNTYCPLSITSISETTCGPHFPAPYQKGTSRGRRHTSKITTKPWCVICPLAIKQGNFNPQQVSPGKSWENSIIRSPEGLQEGVAKGFAEVLARLMLADGFWEDRSTMLCKNVCFVPKIGISLCIYIYIYI